MINNKNRTYIVNKVRSRIMRSIVQLEYVTNNKKKDAAKDKRQKNKN